MVKAYTGAQPSAALFPYLLFVLLAEVFSRYCSTGQQDVPLELLFPVVGHCF